MAEKHLIRLARLDGTGESFEQLDQLLVDQQASVRRS